MSTEKDPSTTTTNKYGAVINLLYEKLTREYDLSIEEIKAATILVKNGVVTIKFKENKGE